MELRTGGFFGKWWSGFVREHHCKALFPDAMLSCRFAFVSESCLEVVRLGRKDRDAEPFDLPRHQVMLVQSWDRPCDTKLWFFVKKQAVGNF